MVEWYHQLDGCKFEKTLGVGDRYGSLSCCSLWGCRKLDTSEWLNWTDSAYKLNKQGENIQPWHTPFPILNQSIVSCLVLTVASWSVYRFLRRQVRWSGIPISLRIFQFIVIHTVKGFSVVNEAEVMFFWNSFAFSMIHWMLAILSPAPLPFLNPVCTSGNSQFTYC